MPSGEQETLAGRLLELYRDEPTPAFTVRPEWTLRRWNQEDRLKRIDTELRNLADRGGGTGISANMADVRRDRRTDRVPHGFTGDRA